MKKLKVFRIAQWSEATAKRNGYGESHGGGAGWFAIPRQPEWGDASGPFATEQEAYTFAAELDDEAAADLEHEGHAEF